MIFLTVGTQERFDRLARAVDDWCGTRQRDDVFGQLADPDGKGFRPSNFEFKSFVEPNEFQRLFESADFIIAHAGMGTIISALSIGKPVLVLPRRMKFKEHRNDHQLGTAEKFGSRQGVRVAWTESDVGPELDGLVARHTGTGGGSIAPFADQTLIDAIRSHIMEKQ